MKKQLAYLCVGGPYDGRRVGINDRQLGFKAPRAIKMPMRLPLADMPPTVESTIQFTYYVAECVRFPKGDEVGEVWLWRPQEQSIEDTMLRLLERYEQAAGIIWSGSPF